MIVPAQLEQHERIKAVREKWSGPTKSEIARQRAEMTERISVMRKIREKIDRDRREAVEQRMCELMAAYRLTFDSMANPKRTVREIQANVAEACGVTVADILGPRRQAKIVIARQFAFWMARRDTNYSFPAIGRLFGDKDHTTVMHGFAKIDRLIAAGQLPDALMALVREGK